jgi:hypothetical protein
MRRFLVVLIIGFVACAPPPKVHAQFNGTVALQTVEVPKVLNAVTAAQTTPLTCTGSLAPVGGSACIQNLGQTIHILNYTVAGSATLIQIRLEGSWDGTNFVPISDDATDLTSGEVVGLGFYPAVRANLVQCIGCGGAVTLTANYSGHFAGPSTFSGFYNPSQILRKVVFTSLPANTNQTTNGIAIPYGVISGNLIIKASGATFPAGSTIQIRSHVGENSLLYPTLNLQNSTNTQSLMLPVTPGTSIDVIYTSGGASAATFSAYFIAYSPALLPASAQPPTVSNSEVTQLSGAASVTIGAGAGQQVYVYSVSAHCSAGTATLTISGPIANGSSATLFTSGTGEVGTGTYRYQWNPGLTGPNPVSLSTVITLSTCGVGNTGTLDVQASVF